MDSVSQGRGARICPGLAAFCRILRAQGPERLRTAERDTVGSEGVVVRTLKLQMQMTIDGFVAGPEGQLDWMTRRQEPQLIAFITQLTDTSDTILLGRKMTPGFVGDWEKAAAKPDSPEPTGSTAYPSGTVVSTYRPD
jgi:hypothetical protein